MQKIAFITGITGQDGSFMEGTPNFHLHSGHMGDSMSLIQIIGKVRPDEIYNLAAQSHVQLFVDS